MQSCFSFIEAKLLGSQQDFSQCIIWGNISLRHKMESEENLQYGMQRFVKLKSVNRVIAAHIQTIKSVAKGAQRKKPKLDYKIMYIVCCIIK